MASSPRKSIDSLASVTSTPSLQHLAQNTYEPPRIVSNQRIPQRRSSTASSFVSIGGILDSSAHRSSITELGQNGELNFVRPVLSSKLIMYVLYSYLNTSTTPHSPHRSRRPYFYSGDGLQSSHCAGHTTGDTYECTERGFKGIPALS